MTTEIKIELRRGINEVTWEAEGETNLDHLRVEAIVCGRSVMSESGNENLIGSGGAFEAKTVGWKDFVGRDVGFQATAYSRSSSGEKERASVSGKMTRNQDFVALGDKVP